MLKSVRFQVVGGQRLRFIRKAQSLGFSLEEIGEILKLSRAGDTPCSHVLELSRRHLRAVEERIQQLTRFQDQLAGELAKWDGEREPTCRGLCQIIIKAGERAPDAGEVPVHLEVRRTVQHKSRKHQR